MNNKNQEDKYRHLEQAKRRKILLLCDDI